MKQRVKKHESFLNFLVYADSTQQNLIIKALSSEQYDVLSEVYKSPETLRVIHSIIGIKRSQQQGKTSNIAEKQFFSIASIKTYCSTYQRQMAKEMILVPKLKYERLLKQVDPVKEPLTQDTTTIEQTLKQSPEKQQQTVNDFEFADTTNLLQSGTGFVSKKKKVGKPPGISDIRQKEKTVHWLKY